MQPGDDDEALGLAGQDVKVKWWHLGDVPLPPPPSSPSLSLGPRPAAAPGDTKRDGWEPPSEESGGQTSRESPKIQQDQHRDEHAIMQINHPIGSESIVMRHEIPARDTPRNLTNDRTHPMSNRNRPVNHHPPVSGNGKESDASRSL